MSHCIYSRLISRLFNLKKSKYVLSLLFFFCFLINISAQEDTERTAFLDSISNNPSGKIYFFDGKEISEREMFAKGEDGELEGTSGAMYEGKDAILRFGERYRYGVLFWESNKKENEEEE